MAQVVTTRVRHVSGGTIIVIFLIAAALYLILQRRNGRNAISAGAAAAAADAVISSRGGDHSSRKTHDREKDKGRDYKTKTKGSTSDSGSSSGDEPSSRSRSRSKDGGVSNSKKEKRSRKSSTPSTPATGSSTSSNPRTPKTSDTAPPTSASAPPIMSAPVSAPLSNTPWVRDPSQRPERPSGRDPAVRLTRDENGNWDRGPRPGAKRRVSFNDGGQVGKEASTYAMYNVDDKPTTIYDQSHTKLPSYVSHQRGEDDAVLFGKIDGSESPAHALKSSGKISENVLKLMSRAEQICETDFLNPDLDRGMVRQALMDDWVDNVGPVPRIIFKVVAQIVAEAAVDLPSIMAELSTPHPQRGGRKGAPPTGKEVASHADKFFISHLDACGLDIKLAMDELNCKSWSTTPPEQIRQTIKMWTARGSGAGIKEQLSGRLLLGFFINDYRGKATIRPSKMGNELPSGFSSVLGEHVKILLDWFRYIGRLMLVSRMFSPTGAYIGDLQMLVAVSRRRTSSDGSVKGFMIDYTLHIPNAKPTDEETSKQLMYLLHSVSRPMERTNLLALRRMTHLGQTTMRKRDGSDGFDTFNPAEFIRLTLRPAIPLNKLDPSAVRNSLQNPQSKSLPLTKVIGIVPAQMEEFYFRNRGKHALIDTFSRLYRGMNGSAITFNSQTQFHWYKHPSNEKFDGFDKPTFTLLLMLCGKGFGDGYLSGDFKNKAGEYFKDAGEADLNRQYDMEYVHVRTLDFGTLLPIVNPQVRQPQFVNLDDFKALRIMALPYVPWSNNQASNHPASATLVFREAWGLTHRLYGPKGVHIVFVGEDQSQRARFLQELAQAFMAEFDQNGRPVNPNSNLSLESIDTAITMVRSRVHFRLKSQNYPGAIPEEELRNLRLTEFDIPR